MGTERNGCMIMITPSSPAHPSRNKNALACLPHAEFVEGWRRIVGEPPAVMLDSRSEMIKLLLESVPIADPAQGPGVASLGYPAAIAEITTRF